MSLICRNGKRHFHRRWGEIELSFACRVLPDDVIANPSVHLPLRSVKFRKAKPAFGEFMHGRNGYGRKDLSFTVCRSFRKPFIGAIWIKHNKIACFFIGKRANPVAQARLDTRQFSAIPAIRRYGIAIPWHRPFNERVPEQLNWFAFTSEHSFIRPIAWHRGESIR